MTGCVDQASSRGLHIAVRNAKVSRLSALCAIDANTPVIRRTAMTPIPAARIGNRIAAFRRQCLRRSGIANQEDATTIPNQSVREPVITTSMRTSTPRMTAAVRRNFDRV